MKLYNYLIMQGSVLAIAPENRAVARVVGETSSGHTISPNRGVDAVYDQLLRYFKDWESGNQPVTPDPIAVDRYDRRRHVAELGQILMGRM